MDGERLSKSLTNWLSECEPPSVQTYVTQY